ncbi:DNA-3-methyladenine glycosylase 2 family protein [Oscillibacter sp.]|uniref:DNA-3-methyladenine glycosylase family protein n=1 Tax=Oscillibacter sp. TaxID=1945593 RepID=UPI0028A9C5DD|nr:DNA-3-methyladenine glycosylase 2 family protein [Oscillibacter sp.]
MKMFYEYGQAEMDYLKSRDKRLCEVIERVGIVRRPIDGDIFIAVVRAILGQQVSRQAGETVYERMATAMNPVTPQRIAEYTVSELQAFGTSFKKAEYLYEFAALITSGAFALEPLRDLPDEEVIHRLSELKGIGAWTAEMLLISALGRKDVFSFGDLAIHRGLRMVYRHKEITREMFERYRKRYSPYGTVASIYLWTVAAGAIPELTDPKESKKRRQCHD